MYHKIHHLRSSFTQGIQKGFIFFCLGLLFLGGTHQIASAEVDSAVLMNILSQIAGTGSTASTGTTQNSNTSTTESGGGSATTSATTTSSASTSTSSTETDRLMITINSTGKVGESMDVTIKALTKNGVTATDYRGTIFISVDNDYKAVVPSPDGYNFTSLDKGTKTFSKGLSFSKAGTFQVSVSDFAQAKITGNTKVVISPATIATQTTVTTTTTATGTTNPTLTTVHTNTGSQTQSISSAAPIFTVKKVEIGDKKATITFTVSNDTSDIKKFTFLYADTTGNAKKVTTFPKEQIKNSSGEYVWYIPDLELTKYVMSIAGVGKDNEDITGVTSKPFEANLSLLSAGKCIIPNVSGLRVLSKKDSSILYWDNIPEAVVYKVYKKDANGEYVFLQETKQDSYTVHVSDGSVKYEDFSVKAVCSDGTESTNFAPSTSIQTGPKEIIILIAISALIGLFVVKRRKNLG